MARLISITVAITADNPKTNCKNPLYSFKLAVWCRVSKVVIAGSYFFEEGEVTRWSHCWGNSEFWTLCYRATQFSQPQLEVLEINMAEMLFKKDEATARLSNASIAVAREMFLPQNLNSRFSNLHCPARSPYLMILWLLLMGSVVNILQSIIWRLQYMKRLLQFNRTLYCRTLKKNV